MNDRPTNDEREALIAAGRGGALGPDEAAEVPLLSDLLADPSTWAQPRADLEDAVVQAVATAERASVARHEPRASRRTAAHRRNVVLSALAAAAAVLVVIAAVTTIRGGTTTDFTAQLNGTELALGASATGDITRNDSGFRITLDARGLPGLGANEYYQAWLKNAAGTLVPIGSFSSSDDQVTLWSGVSPADFPTMTVTVEAADNQQGSSGRRVLEGQVQAD